MSFREIIIQQLFNGLLLGSFYGLVALGYSMVYGIIKLLNFAHADIYMVGGFCSLSLLAFFGGTFFGNGWLGIIAAMLITMIIVGLLGVLIERIAYRPLRDAPRLSLLITALGVSMILYNSVMVITGGEYKAYKTGLGFEGFPWKCACYIHSGYIDSSGRFIDVCPSFVYYQNDVWQGDEGNIHGS